MKVTAKMHVLSYIRAHGEVSGSELENQAAEWFIKASVISRRARELASDGYLERLVENGRVCYRTPLAMRPTYSNAKALSWLNES